MRKYKNYTDDFGKKQGYWEIYHKNGNIKSQCYYQDNFIVGVYKLFSENGMLKRYAFYKTNLTKEDYNEILFCESNIKIHNNIGIKVMEYYTNDSDGKNYDFNIFTNDIAYESVIEDGKFIVKYQISDKTNNFIGFYLTLDKFGYFNNNSEKIGYWHEMVYRNKSFDGTWNKESEELYYL